MMSPEQIAAWQAAHPGVSMPADIATPYTMAPDPWNDPNAFKTWNNNAEQRAQAEYENSFTSGGGGGVVPQVFNQDTGQMQNQTFGQATAGSVDSRFLASQSPQQRQTNFLREHGLVNLGMFGPLQNSSPEYRNNVYKAAFGDGQFVQTQFGLAYKPTDPSRITNNLMSGDSGSEFYNSHMAAAGPGGGHFNLDDMALVAGVLGGTALGANALGGVLGGVGAEAAGGAALGGELAGEAVLPGALGADLGYGSAGADGLAGLGEGAGGGGITDFSQLLSGSPQASIAPGFTNATGGTLNAASFTGGAAGGAGGLSLSDLTKVPTGVPGQGGGSTTTAPAGTDANGNLVDANGTPYGPPSDTTARPNVDQTISPAETAAQTAAKQSALAKLISGGEMTAQDWLSLGGTAATALTGILGADASRSANNAATDKMLALGAPARQAFNDTLSPSYDPTKMPGYSSAIDSVMNSYLRKASTGGNPFSNPGVSMEANKYVTDTTALPALNNYRNSLATAGNWGIGNANQPNVNAANSVNQGTNAVAGGLGALSAQPATDYSSIIRTILNQGGNLA